MNCIFLASVCFLLLPFASFLHLFAPFCIGIPSFCFSLRILAPGFAYFCSLLHRDSLFWLFPMHFGSDFCLFLHRDSPFLLFPMHFGSDFCLFLLPFCIENSTFLPSLCILLTYSILFCSGPYLLYSFLHSPPVSYLLYSSQHSTCSILLCIPHCFLPYSSLFPYWLKLNILVKYQLSR